jgi:protein SCO1
LDVPGKPELLNLKKGILMTDLKRRSLVAALGAAPIAVPLLTHAQSTGSETKWKQIPARERIRQRYFPNLVLTDQDGRKLKFYDDLVKDKIVIFNMFYAQCEGKCVPVTRNLARLQKLLGDRVGKDIFMYSFTLSPKEDTVAALKHYARMHKVKPGWLFLTGAVDDMETIRRKLGFVDPDPEVDKVKSNHIGVIKYGNEPMQRWGGCPGMSEPIWIAETLSWVDWPQNRNNSLRERMSVMRSQAKGGAK